MSAHLERTTSGHDGTTSTSLDDGFFVLTWLSFGDAHNSATSTRIDTKRLVQDLESIDSFLQEDTNLVESLTYKGSNISSHAAILAYLQKEAESLLVLPTTAGTASEVKKRNRHGWRVDVFNASESLFEFFLPVSSEGPTIGKFWGALHTLLGVCIISDVWEIALTITISGPVRGKGLDRGYRLDNEAQAQANRSLR